MLLLEPLAGCDVMVQAFTDGRMNTTKKKNPHQLKKEAEERKKRVRCWHSRTHPHIPYVSFHRTLAYPASLRLSPARTRTAPHSSALQRRQLVVRLGPPS